MFGELPPVGVACFHLVVGEGVVGPVPVFVGCAVRSGAYTGGVADY